MVIVFWLYLIIFLDTKIVSYLVYIAILIFFYIHTCLDQGHRKGNKETAGIQAEVGTKSSEGKIFPSSHRLSWRLVQLSLVWVLLFFWRLCTSGLANLKTMFKNEPGTLEQSNSCCSTHNSCGNVICFKKSWQMECVGYSVGYIFVSVCTYVLAQLCICVHACVCV